MVNYRPAYRGWIQCGDNPIDNCVPPRLHRIDVTWASWRLKSPATRIFVQLLVPIANDGNTGGPQYCINTNPACEQRHTVTRGSNPLPLRTIFLNILITWIIDSELYHCFGYWPDQCDLNILFSCPIKRIPSSFAWWSESDIWYTYQLVQRIKSTFIDLHQKHFWQKLKSLFNRPYITLHDCSVCGPSHVTLWSTLHHLLTHIKSLCGTPYITCWPTSNHFVAHLTSLVDPPQVTLWCTFHHLLTHLKSLCGASYITCWPTSSHFVSHLTSLVDPPQVTLWRILHHLLTHLKSLCVTPYITCWPTSSHFVVHLSSLVDPHQVTLWRTLYHLLTHLKSLCGAPYITCWPTSSHFVAHLTSLVDLPQVTLWRTLHHLLTHLKSLCDAPYITIWPISSHFVVHLASPVDPPQVTLWQTSHHPSYTTCRPTLCHCLADFTSFFGPLYLCSVQLNPLIIRTTLFGQT